ncbi:hypothetical protein HFP15_26220 [Amycolatopsis sp. K13G38]|uniref:Uncharacterized protein n=1 Tax=Amycolatopsis acididurans TaxID=2724524 RepID=A0ABX1JBW5_9PSEU|nr:hypothetical protein [Amycolatopsis acididurans]NKQ56379.1 hypothetical protein [Amycolatopsis acididurans]
MNWDASGITSFVVVVAVLGWLCWAGLYPVLFRLFLLPSIGRRRGWRARGSLVPSESYDDLPGDGSQGWDTPLPGMVCEFVGTYNGRPVHGVEVSITHWRRRIPGHTPRKYHRYYTVLTVATSDRPFANFNAGRRGAVVNGDPMAFYPDFVEWARNRRLHDSKHVLQEDHGMRSISWFGHLTRGRLFRSLDRLTQDPR